MMKIRVLLLAACLVALPVSGAGAVTIDEMLAAAVRQPAVRLAALAAAENESRTKAANAALYPRINAWSRLVSFNSPTNLRPMPPTEVNVAAGESIPFSREILRYGLNIDAPLYVGELLALRKKAEVLANKAKIAHQGKIASQEAAVVSLDSALLSLTHLDAAIAARIASLEKTHADLVNKVDSGRSAGAELLKIENSINDLEVQRNDIAAKIIDIRRDLKHITGLDIGEPAPLQLVGEIKAGPYLGEELAQAGLEAARLEVERRRKARYPKLSLYGTISGNDGEAYNTDHHIFRSYSFAGLSLSMPVFDQTLKSNLDTARIQERKAKQELADTRIDLAAQEKSLNARLAVLARSLELQQKSLDNAEKLLEIARVSYDSGRTTTEEYLRYESQVLANRAALLSTENEVWLTRSRLATLYGQPLEGVVK